jgi:hypothetical protein
MKTKLLPKGFLSITGNPTINAIMMFFIYLSFVPKGWNKKEVYLPAVAYVRNHFNVDYGFENMIRWGIQHGCCKSKTSSGRHTSMSEAYFHAQTLVGAGVKLAKLPMKYLILRKKAA